MAGNLTRDEARERARALSVESYRVELDLTTGERTFSSVTTVRFRCRAPGATTFIELVAGAVHQVVLNGALVDLPAISDGRIALPALEAENELRVAADCDYSHTGEGLHHFIDPVDGAVYLYTQFETADAHRMYACFDQPDLKATFELTVTAPEGWQVISNTGPDVIGAVTGVPGTVRWHFPATPPVSTYITALAAGPYHVRRAEHDGIPLGVFCRASLAEHLDHEQIFEVTRRGFDFFHGAFGVRYPFGKYDQLFVPEFNAGAMENAGCVTLLEDYVFRSRVTDAMHERRAETILHEMAHMWFGDLVTMRWWDDLWLNESFATYASVLCQAEATRWRSAWTTFANLWKIWAYRQDQLPSTHPIAADIPDIHAVEVNFDGITYAKGASVLKQLAAYVDTDNFLEGVRRYFQRNAWGNTTLADLLAALEETSGRDLASWSKQWLEAAGVNTLHPEFTVDGENRFTRFAIRQEAPPDHPTLRAHRLGVGLYDRTEAGIVRRRTVELDVTGERTEVPELTGERRPDLVLVNDDDLTYAKIRLDQASLRTVVEGIGDITESLPRALCWAAAWDMCRDGEMATRDYLRLIVASPDAAQRRSGIDAVSDISIVHALLRQATSAVRQYADPAWRETGLIILADALDEMIHRAEPASDRQLAYVQAFATVARSPEHLALIRGLLDGTRSIDGLSVDTDLRWTLLHWLVSRGVAGPAEIDAELARDRTATGERKAASARAAIPDTAAKEAAWQRIITGNQIANALFRATLGGFVDPDKRDLLEPFAERYFEVVGRIWEEWTSDMASTFVMVAYPSFIISEQTISRTDDYIEQANPPAALHRLLIENRDGVARALRAQACDRAAGA